ARCGSGAEIMRNSRRRSRLSANSTMICCAHNRLRQCRGESGMIEMRRRQLSFGDGLIAEEVSDLREDWMKHADEALADEEIEKIVRGVGATPSQQPSPRLTGYTGRRGAAAVDPEAHPQLEF